MTQTVDLEEIKLKLIERLKPSGWATKLRSFINSTHFDQILEALYNEREAGKRFTPPLRDVFRAFEECPVDKLRIVMIGQDPYPYLDVADGIAFSCSKGTKVQPSLQKMFEAIEHTVYQEFPTHMDPNLQRWSNQGILMLNKALTCQVDKVGSHYDIWNDFIMYVIDILNFTNSGLIFVLLGQKAQEIESCINQSHYILKASHPASAAYTKSMWDCNDLFNEANRIISQNNGPQFKIEW
jgi:uracil-DNA glycosylase